MLSHVTSTDGSMDCSYNAPSSTKPSSYEIVLATSLAVSMFLLILIGLLYMLHCRHGKKIRQTDSMERLTDNPDHDDLSDHSCLDPTEEAGTPIKQMVTARTTAIDIKNKKKTKETKVATEETGDPSSSSSMVPQF